MQLNILDKLERLDYLEKENKELKKRLALNRETKIYVKWVYTLTNNSTPLEKTFESTKEFMEFINRNNKVIILLDMRIL